MLESCQRVKMGIWLLPASLRPCAGLCMCAADGKEGSKVGNSLLTTLKVI